MGSLSYPWYGRIVAMDVRINGTEHSSMVAININDN